MAELIGQLEEEMKAAAAELRFEEAALLRDELVELRLAAAAGSTRWPPPTGRSTRRWGNEGIPCHRP